jgi:hypothetical protein
MTRSLALYTIYVEGDDDRDILSPWFPHLQFKTAGGKDKVRRTVDEDQASYGLLDRDFAPEDQVAASREPHSRITIMQRYCIENYLLEPVIITAAVNPLRPITKSLQAWFDEAHVRQMLHQWASELALYAAANSIISQWRDRIMLDKQLGFLRYFGPLPPVSCVDVLASLQRRLAALTPAAQIEAELDARYTQVAMDTSGWEGLQRWISGKVLVEDYLYHHVFEPAGFSQSRSRALLIEAGRQHIPSELQELAQWWAT